MEAGVTLAGVTLKVTELTGAQGDVIIMHPCVLLPQRRTVVVSRV
jgi:hypothetical protein